MRYLVLGVPVDSLMPNEWQDILEGWLSGTSAKIISTPNAEMIVASQKDPILREHLGLSDICLPDSASLHYAIVALSDDRLQHRYTGVDTLWQLAELASKRKKRLVLFGGNVHSAELAKNTLISKYPHLNIISIQGGSIPYTEDGVRIPLEVIKELQVSQPEILAVALGHGKQEAFLQAIKQHLPTLKIGIGVGGAFELIAGTLPRAPKWMRKRGFEWLWRLIQEPKRFPRIVNAVIVFPTLILYDLFRKHRLCRGSWQVIKEVFKHVF